MVWTVGSISRRHSSSVAPSAVMRSEIVALLAVMPTVGVRPRRIMSGSIASIWLSPAPKQLIFRRTIFFVPPASFVISLPQIAVPHFAHFGRHAGQGEKAAGISARPRNFQIDARRRAVAVHDHPAAGGKHRLQLVLLGHFAFSPGEETADLLQGLGIKHQFPADGLGQRFPREIVGRGA